MENTAYNDPKDDHIINKDTAITNKDGDNNLEKGEQSNSLAEIDVDRIPTPDDSLGDPVPSENEENTSNKGQGPAGENL
ncbi:MAG: hypothetical protein JWR38_1792 [Mucilaginibacter sp.]|nr:hypothetical protein [Mucilaginibacter sp.]